MKWRQRLSALLAALAAMFAGVLFVASHRGRAPASPEGDRAQAAAAKDPALVARGDYLATAGGCAACHTAVGGTPYAGGRAVLTPFGSIPAPNLTPDRATGLGDWSFADFWRALHSGIGRDGELLYPVFPYTSYTWLSRDDARAIFAYLQSLPPVHRTNAAPALGFPYDLRSGLSAWQAMYFREGRYRPDPGQSAQWNRGAYLVRGAGHCNECHAPRNALGATAADAWLAGGRMPANWYAPDLGMRANGGLRSWSEQDVVDLLKTGRSARGTAFGPMAEVVMQSTQYLRDDDLEAIATYLQSLPARPQPPAQQAAFDDKAVAGQGETIYAERCAGCHGKDGRGVAGVYPPLDGNSSVIEPSGINAVRMVLLGGFSPVTTADPRPYSMPPFAQQLGDANVAAVVSYIRQAWSNRASAVLERDVGKYRHTPDD